MHGKTRRRRRSIIAVEIVKLDRGARERLD
jgi:hypothetical protein